MTTPFTADDHRAARARAFLACVRAQANLPKGKLPQANLPKGKPPAEFPWPPESVQRQSGRKPSDEFVAKAKPARAKPARKRKPARIYRATDAQYAAFRRRLYGKEGN